MGYFETDQRSSLLDKKYENGEFIDVEIEE